MPEGHQGRRTSDGEDAGDELAELGEVAALVHVDDLGTFTIVGAEEGAFRVRNGRVEALGRAGAASTWNRQPAAKFFGALSANQPASAR